MLPVLLEASEYPGAICNPGIERLRVGRGRVTKYGRGAGIRCCVTDFSASFVRRYVAAMKLFGILKGTVCVLCSDGLFEL